MTFGPLTFLEPLSLLGLLVLPIIWWVLKITPPRPKEQIFPPLRLLYDLKKEEETPQSTPPWLLLFRLLMGALLALALAKPILFSAKETGNKPIVMIIDNGWAAAENWALVEREAAAIIKQAVSDNRSVAFAPTIQKFGNEAIKFAPAKTALEQIRKLNPLPLDAKRDDLAKRLSADIVSGADVIWLSDGLDYGYASALADSLKSADQLNIYLPTSETAPIYPGAISETAEGFRVIWKRADTNSLRTVDIVAFGGRGQVLGRAKASFTAKAQSTDSAFSLPAELRNRVARIQAEGIGSAATTLLLDDSWGRPLVGLLNGSDANVQPLLSEWLYIEKALSPVADIYKGDLDQLVAVSPSVIIMSDRARTISPELTKYVENGGMLVRFAGDKLAKRADPLVPVDLRYGGRDLGGALAWETPQGLAPFAPDSPFYGLSIREDIKVKKQIMARPGSQTDARTWARLTDGSPIVTSGKFGLGRIVLFHVTAGPEWSDLPLSGLYVNMLKRILPLARPNVTTTTSKGTGDWTPQRTLDGFGRLGTPPITATPIANADFAKTVPSLEHPPGLYQQGTRRAALNTVNAGNTYELIKTENMNRQVYGKRTPQSLSGILLAIVALMLAFDVLLSLLASGRLGTSLRAVGSSAAILLAIVIFALVPAQNSHAQSASVQDRYSVDALDLRLAYIITGDERTDQMSEDGLYGLITELNRRTTIEPVGVRGIDLETDNLEYYPFLYWPVPRTQKPLSDAVARKLNQYMATGGTLVLDTRDADRMRLLGAEVHPGLAVLSKQLEIPKLGHPPFDHVITKTFFLIQQYPGRFAEGKIWVEADQRGSARDGVSSVIIGGNDWASAWAKDKKGRAIAVLENEIPRQREMAYRFGINLAMYTLAGNYKSDQVHAATLVKRLGTLDENAPPSTQPKPKIIIEEDKP
ncbi:MAG TPA: DUF4159 domain-containing protein [Hellea balneolensis]|uniref:DUF4159 domain-containing protein n=1 Tax=Hellea balneolensis TaxID=287478 RepID=A0A7C5LUP3_9PROT|nr:DUF4159 domain-containing protein [Hellea balneolensis]